MELEHRPEVDLGKDIAVKDDDGTVQILVGVFHRPRGAEWLGLNQVSDFDTQRSAVPDDRFDPLWLIVQAEDYLVDFGDLSQ